MNCRIIDLRNKEVINVNDGTRLGCVCDVEINTEDAKLMSVIIYGRHRFFGLFGKEEDVVIPWDMVQTIGDDTILVRYIAPISQSTPNNPFSKFFNS